MITGANPFGQPYQINKWRWYGVLVLLDLVDALCTQVEAGQIGNSVEANPVMARVIADNGFLGVVIFKLFFLAILGVIMFKKLAAVRPWTLMGLTGVFSLLALYHVWVIWEIFS